MGREPEQFFKNKRMEWEGSVHIIGKKSKYSYMKILFYFILCACMQKTDYSISKNYII